MTAVIFDMDGTLLDTQRIYTPAWEAAGRMQGITGLGGHVINVCGMNRNGSDGYLKRNFKNLDIEKFRKDERDYIDRYGKVTFKPGAKALLTFLKEKGVKIALASGTARPYVEQCLKIVGIENDFDAVVCGVEVENGKPAPDIYLYTARLLGVDPRDCFVFEDAANGIKAGHLAGMKCIGIPDTAEFDRDTKSLLFAELSSLDEAIELLKPYI